MNLYSSRKKERELLERASEEEEEKGDPPGFTFTWINSMVWPRTRRLSTVHFKAFWLDLSLSIATPISLFIGFILVPASFILKSQSKPFHSFSSRPDAAQFCSHYQIPCKNAELFVLFTKFVYM